MEALQLGCIKKYTSDKMKLRVSLVVKCFFPLSVFCLIVCLFVFVFVFFFCLFFRSSNAGATPNN